MEDYLSFTARTKKDDGNNVVLIGAGILATAIGPAATFMLSNNNRGSNGMNRKAAAPSPKKGCGCGMKH